MDVMRERPRGAEFARVWAEERKLLLLLLIAFVGYFLYFGGSTTIGSDTADYQAAARVLTDGWHQILDRVPGYPLLLVATGAQEGPSRSLFVVQLSAYLVGVFLSVRIARRLGATSRWTTALAIVLLLPPVVGPVVAIGTEGPAEFLLVVAAWLFVRWFDDQRARWLIGLGLTVGASAWVRPTFTLWFIPVAGLVAMASTAPTLPRRAAAGAAAAAPALGVVALLVVINAVRFGYPTTTPLLGWNLSTRTVAYVEEAPLSEEPLRSTLIEARDQSLVSGESHSGLMYIWSVRPTLQANPGQSAQDLDRRMLRLNLRLIAHNPLDYLSAVATASGTYVLLAGADDDRLNSAAARAVWAPMHLLLGAVFLAQWCVMSGLAVLRRLQRRTVLALGFLYLTMFYNAAVSTLIEVGNPRYRIPTDALAMIAVAVGLTAWGQARSSPIAGSGVQEDASTPGRAPSGVDMPLTAPVPSYGHGL
jgi:hypothetical protein